MTEEWPAAPVTERPGARGPLFVLAVLAAYAVVGASAGWVWFQLWEPSTGVVFQHRWVADGEALRGDFSGTGLFVLVAGGAGLALGLLSAVAGSRQPVLTLVAALAGSLLAAWLMLEVGQRLGPPDPHALAATADDGTTLPSALRVSGLSPLLAFPMGTLVALALVFAVFSGRPRDRASPAGSHR